MVMKGGATCPNVLACSIYDTKPTENDNVKWTPIKKKFYSKIEKKTVDVTFHCLNDIHMYNFGMGLVDVTDKLRM